MLAGIKFVCILFNRVLESVWPDINIAKSGQSLIGSHLTQLTFMYN